MRENIKFNSQEYMSIRTEMIQRISVMNAQSHTAVLTIVTALGAGLTLYYNMQNNQIDNQSNYIFLYLISSFIFLIPIIYLLPLAIKSGENLIQISSISAYIRVFYEYISSDDRMMNWETSNNLLSNANVDRGKKSAIMKFFNEEYTVLSGISFILYVAFSINSIRFISPFVNYKIFVAVIIVYILFGILALLGVGLIHKCSGMKYTLMKYTPFYIEGYIKRAVQLGIIEENEVPIIKEKVNAKNIIDIKFTDLE